MKHIHAISRMAAPPRAQVSLVETIILYLLAIFFNTWDNFPSVIQNLQKYYAKTP